MPSGSAPKFQNFLKQLTAGGARVNARSAFAVVKGRMRIGLACAALAVAIGCAKRVAPSAVEDRTVTSGVPTSFGSDQELPPGTRIVWDFGDGTPPADGARATHAYPRAGTFNVTETVQSSGEASQSVKATVTVLRRAVPAAVPPDVRAALVEETPWRRMAWHRETATRLGLREVFDDVARSFSAALGFDTTDPAAVAANGFDPDEGIALYTVPQDGEALVAVIGTSDDAKALSAVKRLLAYEGGSGRFASGPFALSPAQLEGVDMLVGTSRTGEKVAVLQRFGYVYLRLPGMTDPALALRSAAALPPGPGLQNDPTYLRMLKHVGTGDVLFFTRDASAQRTPSRYTGALGAAAFAVVDQKERVIVRLFGEPKELKGEALVNALTPAKPPPDLAAHLPEGPAAYLKVSGQPRVLWNRLLALSNADADRARARVQELTGLDFEKDLLPSFTGNVGVAVYLDSFALLDAILGEQVASFDQSALLVAAELVPGRAQVLQAAIDKQVRKERRIALARGTAWKLGEDGLEAAVDGDLLYVSLGGQNDAQEEPAPASRRRGRHKAPPQLTLQQFGRLGAALAPNPSAHSLSDELKAAGVQGFNLETDQIAWMDVQGVVRSIQAAAREQGGALGAGTRMVVDRFSAVRDALLEARPGPDGLAAQVLVRFQGRPGK
jgi:PKD domain